MKCSFVGANESFSLETCKKEKAVQEGRKGKTLGSLVEIVGADGGFG